MVKKNQFTVEQIEEFFTLPSGGLEVHMVEALNDILAVRTEKKLENKVIFVFNSFFNTILQCKRN